MANIENFNTAFATNYRFEFVNAPELNYFCQNAQLPGISSIGVEQPYKNVNTFIQADRIEYDPMNINFIVDERFANYLFIHNWMRTNAEKETPHKNQADGTLHILTGNKTPNLMVTFYGMFPQMLSSLDFESAVTDSNVIMCSATFRYQTFDIQRVT